MEKSERYVGSMEKYIISMEEYLQTPYIWGMYKLVILPPTFPFGGMENPELTFSG